MNKILYVLGAVAACVLAYLLYWFGKKKGRETPLPSFATEIAAARAKADAEKLVAEEGAKTALRRVETEYQEAIQKLNEKEQVEAERLTADPGELARFLVRAGRRK